MVGVHAGLLTLAFSILYTEQPPGWFEPTEYAGFGLIGLALVAFAIVRRRDTTGVVGSGLLALGAAAALWMSWDPQLAALPGLSAIAETGLGELNPSLAHIGVLIAALSLALQIAVDRRMMPREVPFGGGTIAAALLVLALGIIMHLALRGLYDLSGTSGIALLSFRTVSFTLLLLVCLVTSGVRGVGNWAHLYLGIALLGAVARNAMMG